MVDWWGSSHLKSYSCFLTYALDLEYLDNTWCQAGVQVVDLIAPSYLSWLDCYEGRDIRTWWKVRIGPTEIEFQWRTAIDYECPSSTFRFSYDRWNKRESTHLLLFSEADCHTKRSARASNWGSRHVLTWKDRANFTPMISFATSIGIQSAHFDQSWVWLRICSGLSLSHDKSKWWSGDIADYLAVLITNPELSVDEMGTSLRSKQCLFWSPRTIADKHLFKHCDIYSRPTPLIYSRRRK